MKSKMTTQDLITMYKSQRYEAKLGQQLFAIPRRDDDMIQQQVFYYYVGDRRRTAVDFTCEICLHLNYLRIKSVTPRQYVTLQESTTPMEDLINNDLIHPFLLFVGGYHIPWENITVITSQEEYDLLIHGLSTAFFDKINGQDGVIESAYVIDLPDSIEYRQGGFPIDDQTLFAFNEEGELVTSGTGYICIQNFEQNVEIIDTNVTEASFMFANDPMFKYFPENVFVFKDNAYDGSAKAKVLATAVKLYDGVLPGTETPEEPTDPGEGDTGIDPEVPPTEEEPPVEPEPEPTTPPAIFCRIFHNTKLVTPSYDNIRKLSMTNLQTHILSTLNGTPVDFIKKISPSFDPNMSREKDFETNKTEYLDYLAAYDSALFNRVYQSNKDFVELEVNGEWMLAHRDEDGYFKIPRRFQDGINYYIIILVNGELYEYYRNHKYEFGYFYCPVQNIEPTDDIEIWYFKSARNFEIPANIKSNEPFYRLDPWIYNENLKIFSQYTEDTYFTFPADGIQQFPVEYSYEYDPDDEKALRIRYTNEAYYNRPVTLVSSRRFQYFLYTMEETENPDIAYFSVDLGTKFNFCNEYDRFLVFYNGKRLINDLYRLVLPNRTSTPFYKAMIYLCVPIVPGDRIEIFYLPHHFLDIYDANEGATNIELPEDGLIELDKSLLSFALDKELVSVWVNCRKLPPSAIVNVGANKLQVVADQTSRKDLRITTMIGDEDLYEEFKSRFTSTTSAWDECLDMTADTPAFLMGLNTPSITDTDPEAFPETVPTTAIMHEIIRDWYMANAMVNTTAPFVYDYDDVDQSDIIGQDPGGNDLLGAADSNRADNLDVIRPWP